MTWVCRCPMCGTAIPYPDKPVRVQRGNLGGERTLLADLRCPSCPSSVDVLPETGDVVVFRPNQPTTVRVAR